MARYFSSDELNKRTGILRQAVTQMLAAKIPTGSVQFSWFKIDCMASESIVDILRNASNPSGSGQLDSNCAMREVGRGRGIILPALTQIELSSGEDIETVLKHVIGAHPSFSPDPTSHSVIQISIIPRKEKAASNSKTLAPLEQAGTGRLTFMLLSSFTPDQSICSPQSNRVNFPWVEGLADVLEQLQSKVTSPSFSKSKTLLLLRDAITGKQGCTLMLHTTPDEGRWSDSLMWMEISAYLGLEKVASSQR